MLMLVYLMLSLSLSLSDLHLQLDYKNTGWTAENVADFILHCCSEQGVKGGSELIGQVEAAMTETGQTPRVVGAQAVREVLKAWNQAQGM